ncbi:HNH endonuclease [Salmonella phage Shemara]|uniref:HNH endonuclease n=1 Tax=Salmonella phage Shemara TaxID=2596714 RepID=A0A5B8RTL8_9CAUD|nr:HNH endonuclease [Salmonella phage Shemara]QEA10377.1 HNH endonuclease [Salmonella phage Shemara]
MNWHELFSYDEESGELFWRVARTNRIKVGDKAGTSDARGYRTVSVMNRWFKVHRIIWDMFNPNDLLKPGEQIDHINHILYDNRLCNLRKVDSIGNHRNMSLSVNNKTGVNGVCWDSNRSRWKAAISVNGRSIHLGRYKSFEKAVKARKQAEKVFGFHENHGVPNENSN